MAETQPTTEPGARHITLDTYAAGMRRYHEKAKAAWNADIRTALAGSPAGGIEAATEAEVLQVIEDIFTEAAA